jgi:hypothetical protein
MIIHTRINDCGELLVDQTLQHGLANDFLSPNLLLTLAKGFWKYHAVNTLGQIPPSRQTVNQG